MLSRMALKTMRFQQWENMLAQSSPVRTIGGGSGIGGVSVAALMPRISFHEFAITISLMAIRSLSSVLTPVEIPTQRTTEIPFVVIARPSA